MTRDTHQTFNGMGYIARGVLFDIDEYGATFIHRKLVRAILNRLTENDMRVTFAGECVKFMAIDRIFVIFGEKTLPFTVQFGR